MRWAKRGRATTSRAFHGFAEVNAISWGQSGECQFRRVKGHKLLPQLVTALENASLSEGKDVA